jgi:fumigallin biosynthesis monooxygenase-like protein
MAQIIVSRMTHDYDGELVVFLIGMRINKPWRPDLWLPVFNAMPTMLAELSKDEDSGLLGYRLAFGAGGPFVVQYWSSPEKLYAYASERNAAHRPAWAAFNRRARKAPGAVGIWHETYLVERAETIYAGMPVSGLAAATSAVPVARRGETAAERLGARQAA